MKDIKIKAKTLKREIIIFAIVLSIAFAVNIAAIALFKTSWIELYKELYVVFILAFVLYILLIPFRLLANFLQRVFWHASKRI